MRCTHGEQKYKMKQMNIKQYTKYDRGCVTE